jgi:hypothetical protein
MIHYISHRGNLTGPNTDKENHPSYIDYAINEGFDVEIDVRLIDGKIYLGHDEPQYLIDENWLFSRLSRLWVHCKNIEALVYFQESEFNYFWHEEDTVTLTSKKFIWAYPGKQPIKKSIAVMPEIHNDDLSNCIGICSDIVELYKTNQNQ